MKGEAKALSEIRKHNNMKIQRDFIKKEALKSILDFNTDFLKTERKLLPKITNIKPFGKITSRNKFKSLSPSPRRTSNNFLK